MLAGHRLLRGIKTSHFLVCFTMNSLPSPGQKTYRKVESALKDWRVPFLGPDFLTSNWNADPRSGAGAATLSHKVEAKHWRKWKNKIEGTYLSPGLPLFTWEKNVFNSFVAGIVQSLNSLWPHGLQHSRLPCPSLSPGAWSNSCLLSRLVMFPSHLILCCPLLLLPLIFLSFQVFSNKSALCIRWPKYWNFSISPCKLICRVDFL